MRSGFSLLELSIVLVIIGLLAGGVMTGQSLIRAAELRAVSTEYGRYMTAVQTFKDKYMALPGDMTNAASFWGLLNATPATCKTTASTGTATCNGDGDGIIEYTPTGTDEEFRFWQHLANAGLIEGTYNGITQGTNDWSSLIGANVPASKLGNAGWSAWNAANYPGDTVWYTMDYANAFMIGGNVLNTRGRGQVLKPEEAWNIDTKLDDGKPAQGKVIALYWNNACAAADDGTHANNDLVASYKLTDTAIQCALAFRQLF